jgi:acetyl-CoA acyltransferase 1
LKPVFPEWGEGSTTAGNASGIGDGAAICILTTRERAEREGMAVLAKWIGCSVVGKSYFYDTGVMLNHPIGVEPRHMGIGPIAAIPKVLAQAGLTKEDVDVFEVSCCGLCQNMIISSADHMKDQ